MLTYRLTLEPYLSFVVIVTVVVIAQMLIIGLGSLLCWGEFISRITIALLILGVDLCFAAAVLAFGKFDLNNGHDNDYQFMTHVNVAVFFLAIASAVTAVSAFGLVGYNARG